MSVEISIDITDANGVVHGYTLTQPERRPVESIAPFDPVLKRSEVEMLGGLYVDYVPSLWRDMPAGATVPLVPARPKPQRLGSTSRYA